MPEPNNLDRSSWALAGVWEHTMHAGGASNGLFINIQDFLCNLRHLCRQRKIAWETVLEAAEVHFAEEIGLYWMGPEEDNSKLPHCRECPNRTPYSYNDVPYCLKCYQEMKRHGHQERRRRKFQKS